LGVLRLVPWQLFAASLCSFQLSVNHRPRRPAGTSEATSALGSQTLSDSLVPLTQRLTLPVRSTCGPLWPPDGGWSVDAKDASAPPTAPSGVVTAPTPLTSNRQKATPSPSPTKPADGFELAHR